MQNLINNIRDPKDKQFIIEVCSRLQSLESTHTKKEIDSLIQSLKLPLKYHLFITGYYSELMSYKYN